MKLKLGKKRCWIMAWNKRSGFGGNSTTTKKKDRAPLSPNWADVDKVYFINREYLPK